MKISFYNTFYGAEDGKDVLLELARMCYQEQSTAEATLGRIKLFQQIRVLAGVDAEVERRAIDAEAERIVVVKEDDND